jgi:acyl carrier protein
MSQARHTGKIVLTVPADRSVPRRPGTVLVTGGTGLLGGLAARHLAGADQVSGTMLASRSGPAAPGAAALAASIAARGTDVHMVAVDAADRVGMSGVLGRLPVDAPLTAVVHTAGVLDDAMVTSLTPAQVDTVLRPKADAAWNLHDLTAHLDLDAFILYGSAAATFGSTGQGNYAAANAFLDGLAGYRQASGLPATSLAWGLWAEASGLTGQLDQADRARMARGGVNALSTQDGLALLDAALDQDEALLVPARLDLAGARAAARNGDRLPPLWTALVPVSGPGARPVAATSPALLALPQRLAGLSGPEQHIAVLDLVRAHVAVVLGHAEPGGIEPGQAFSDLGFDSLTAVELRNRLQEATGLQLAATLVFDYPSPDALTRHLLGQLAPAPAAAEPADTPAEAGQDSQLQDILASIPLSRIRAAGLLEPLLQLATQRSDTAAPQIPDEGPAIDTLDAESLIRLALDNERTDD